MRGEDEYLSRMPIKRGVLTGLQSQMKCINLWAPADTDLKFSYETIKEFSVWSDCFSSGSSEQFFKNLYIPSSSSRIESKTFSFSYVSKAGSDAS